MNSEIERLRAKATDGVEQIQAGVNQSHISKAAKEREINEAGLVLLRPDSKTAGGGEPTDEVNQRAAATVREARETLKTRPESDFTASDFYARGLAFISEGNLQSALIAFDDAISLSDSSSEAAPQQISLYLVAKGVTLSRLNRPFDAIATYSELDQHFGADPTTAMRERVAMGLIQAGVNKLLLAKQFWNNGPLKRDFLCSANAGLKRAKRQCSQQDRAMVLGNLGYGLFLIADLQAAEAATLECLQLGGKKTLDEQLADANLHRIEPEDSQYEAMLARLWATLPPANNSS